MRIYPLVDGISVVDFGMVQAYLCSEAGRLTLIDTGLEGYAAEIADAIEALGAPISSLRQIIITHGHDDHFGSLAALKQWTGAAVLVHRADAAVVRGEAPQPEPDLTANERILHARISPGVPPALPCAVERELEDGDEVDLFGGSRIIGVPGHTAGSIAVLSPSNGVVFTGDAVAGFSGKPIVGVFNVDRAQARASFVHLASLEFDVACFGHGPPLAGEAALAFRREAEALARAG